MLKYIATNCENLFVINHFKIATRQIKDWSNKGPDCTFGIEPKTFYPDDTTIPVSKEVIDILNQKSIEKDILLIYRNPIKKAITGLIEDFEMACIRMENKEEFYEVINNIKDNRFKKLLLSKIDSGDLHDVLSNTFVYSTDILSSDVYTEMFLEWLIIRRDKFKLFEFHSEPFCFSAYYLLKEYLENNQNFYLFDLDDKNISLVDFLKKYKQFENLSIDTYSNKPHIEKLSSKFENSHIKLDIIDRLSFETLCYNKLRTHKNNII